MSGVDAREVHLDSSLYVEVTYQILVLVRLRQGRFSVAWPDLL